MLIGVPGEVHRHEHRVGLTPFAASRLIQQGHAVLVECGAGESAHFTDKDYQKVGAQVVYTAEEACKRADLICRVGPVSSEEIDLLKPGSLVCGFHHLAVAPRESLERLMELKVTLVGYEIVRDEHGDLPILHAMSEMAGQMAVYVAAHYLQNESGGRGILVGNVPGVPPPTVLILGAGTAGRAAARQALASGAHVIVLDVDLRKLTEVSHELSNLPVTVVASTERLGAYTAIADVILGAVLIPGARAPFVITEEMVQGMKPGSVIIDLSIDQGGCVETSRPTTLDNPTFTAHGVIHYCVPNMTANIARTASRALSNAVLPYLLNTAEKGLEDTLGDDPGFSEGVYLYRGRMVHAGVGETLGIPATPLDRLVGRGRQR